MHMSLRGIKKWSLPRGRLRVLPFAMLSKDLKLISDLWRVRRSDDRFRGKATMIERTEQRFDLKPGAN
jgi:hypothetical protein